MADNNHSRRNSAARWQQCLRHMGCGVAMGAADVIPGVSGGTVALVLGIYERLVTAISHVDGQLLGHLAARRWRAAAEHIDLVFLVSLAAGILTGIVALGMVIHRLLESDVTRPLTLAAFFGMIAASAWIVAKTIRFREAFQVALYLALGLVGAAFAWWLTTLDLTAVDTPSLAYLFFCGMIAICAMILPGISGAHILLILGSYTFVLGIIRGIVHGELTGATLLSLLVFACGCAVGLIAFSKVLRWLLANFHSATMAVLCGFMIGALRKVWPFQDETIVKVGDLEREVFTPGWPTQLGAYELVVVAVIVGSFVGVILVDWYASRTRIDTKDQPSGERLA